MLKRVCHGAQLILIRLEAILTTLALACVGRRVRSRSKMKTPLGYAIPLLLRQTGIVHRPRHRLHRPRARFPGFDFRGAE